MKRIPLSEAVAVWNLADDGRVNDLRVIRRQDRSTYDSTHPMDWKVDNPGAFREMIQMYGFASPAAVLQADAEIGRVAQDKHVFWLNYDPEEDE